MNTVRRVATDDLLWALRAFAEPAPKPIEMRDRLLAELWRKGRPLAHIAAVLGISESNARMRRFLLGLPKRYPRSAPPGRCAPSTGTAS